MIRWLNALCCAMSGSLKMRHTLARKGSGTSTVQHSFFSKKGTVWMTHHLRWTRDWRTVLGKVPCLFRRTRGFRDLTALLTKNALPCYCVLRTRVWSRIIVRERAMMCVNVQWCACACVSVHARAFRCVNVRSHAFACTHVRFCAFPCIRVQ